MPSFLCQLILLTKGNFKLAQLSDDYAFILGNSESDVKTIIVDVSRQNVSNIKVMQPELVSSGLRSKNTQSAQICLL